MLRPMNYRRTLQMCLVGAVILVGVLANMRQARAEYGDIVMNNYSEVSDEAPVVFPHWFHRIRYTCKVCHSDLGFKFKTGAGEVNMVKIMDGQYCGACHDGNIAWSIESCNLCHTGKKGMPAGPGQRAMNALMAPATAATLPLAQNQPKNLENK